ncbi:MAG: CDP-glycerol glycerophosphotransferase family protein [Undibacterium sp.]
MSVTQSSGNNIQDNPNPSADIGFVIAYPFQYYVLKDIYEKLGSRSEFIIDLGVFFPIKQEPSLLGKILALLHEKKVHFRILYYEDYFSGEFMAEFLSRYKGLAGLWERGCMGHPAARKIKKIGVTYGCGKELNSVRPSRGLYDLILSYGPRDHVLFSYYTQSKIVGNPKFDDWFNDTLDQVALSEVQTRLNPDKKTLLYLPTHSDLSSVDGLAAALKRLTAIYNVIVKFHYFLLHEEPERVALLQDPRLIQYGDEADLLVLLKVADVVLSDNSSAIFDAILADRPVIVTDFFEEGYLDETHKQRRTYRRGSAGAVTYSQSIEQVIKRDGSVMVIRRPEELEDRISEALHEPDQYKKSRQQLVADLYSFNDGRCGQRSADAVLACINEVAPPTRPILYHAIEAYKARIGVGSYGEITSLRRQVESYKSALIDTAHREVPFLSVVIFDRYESYLANTLKSLFWQSYPAKRYEVIIITRQTEAAWKKILDGVLPRKHQAVAVKIIGLNGIHLSAAFEKAIQMARGEKIVFSTSGCVPASDWLLDYSVYYKRFSDAVGLGGYLQPLGYSSDLAYFQYKHYVIARMLNLHPSKWKRGSFYTLENALFHQNPAGALAHMSYRYDFCREANVGSLETDSWVMIEKFLKWEALKKGTLAFIPFLMNVEAAPALESLKEESFEMGVAVALLSQNARQMRYREITSLAGVIVECLVYLLAQPWWRERRLIGTIFRATIAQWLGYRITALRLQGARLRKLS